MGVISFIFGVLGMSFVIGIFAVPVLTIIIGIFVKDDKAEKAIYVGAWILVVVAVLLFGLNERKKDAAREAEEAAKASETVAAVEDSSYNSGTDASSYNYTPVYRDGLESDGKIHVYLVGSGETVQAKKSSSIRSMTYYADSDHLVINFNGKEYAYANVGSSLWNSFKEASSSDAFYDSHFKGNKSYWINDYNGKNGDIIVMERVSSAAQSYSSSDNSYSNYSSKNYTSEYDEYAECSSCGEIYSKDEMWDMGGDYICENCADSGDYIVDEYSGELYHIDDYYDMMHEREFGY